jgi:hypothetical protein
MLSGLCHAECTTCPFWQAQSYGVIPRIGSDVNHTEITTDEEEYNNAVAT